MSFNFDLVKTLSFFSKPVKTLFIDGEEHSFSYTVSYDSNNATSGTAPSSQQGSQGETITLATNTGNLARTGYEFIGWNTAADGSGTSYSPGASYTITDNITLYASWRTIYTVSYDTNMASGRYYYISGQTGNATSVAPPASKTISVNESLGTLPSFGNYTYTLSGYSYTVYVEGWYYESSLSTLAKTTDVPNRNLTLYAKWKMTANVGISASITVPKFASSVSWTCYSNGGSRSAINRTGSSGGLGWQMAAPGANRNSDSWTWSGCGGQALTLASQSLTLNGVTRSVSTPGEGGIWDYHIKVLSDLFGSVRTTISAGSKTYSSGNYKVIISWPAIGQNKSGYLTMAYYYADSLKATVATKYRVNVGDSDQGYPISYTVETRTYSGTFASGTYGAAGAYGSASYHTSSVSRVKVGAASGSGYSRTVTVNA